MLFVLCMKYIVIFYLCCLYEIYCHILFMLFVLCMKYIVIFYLCCLYEIYCHILFMLFVLCMSIFLQYHWLLHNCYTWNILSYSIYVVCSLYVTFLLPPEHLSSISLTSS
jgi:hypothetical protein